MLFELFAQTPFFVSSLGVDLSSTLRLLKNSLCGTVLKGHGFSRAAMLSK
jgi:hypothetical protein